MWENLQTVLRSYGEKYVETYKANLRADGAIATGKLHDTARYELTYQDSLYSIELHLQDYWKYLEEGTNPHFPPIKAIEDWIRVKRIVPHANGDGTIPTTKQLAYLIGRKISLDGTLPRASFDAANKDLWWQMEAEIEQAITKDLDTDLDNILIQLQ